jgi:uncharacterized protein YcbX
VQFAANAANLTGMESATVRALATTPVKGLRLQSRDTVRLERLGVVEDRRFYLINARDRMVNGKQIGALQAVVADYDRAREALTMQFPDGESVSGAIELGAGLETRFFSRVLPAILVEGPWSAALSEHTGQELRLVMAPPSGTGIDRGVGGVVSLISRSSIEHLEQVAERDVDPRRFRMLVEVDGIGAHVEDAWVGRRIRVGDALVQMNGHVGRCLVTGRDPDSGVTDLPTLDLLRTYRQGLETTEPLAFGIYGEVLEPGDVRLTDPVRLAD